MNVSQKGSPTPMQTENVKSYLTTAGAKRNIQLRLISGSLELPKRSSSGFSGYILEIGKLP